MSRFLKYKKVILFIFISCLAITSLAQRASVSVPIGVGRSACGAFGGSAVFSYYNYNEITNTLSNATTPIACLPRLRIGASTFTYTADLASVSYNPRDTNVYYLWTTYFPSTRTYVWKWPVGTCPTSTTPRLDTLRSFAFDILGVSFTNNGDGYMLEFGATAPYTAFLRTIDFAAGTISQPDTLALTNGKKLFQSGSGDIGISPSGQMYFAVDNKLFSPDYLSMGDPIKKKITATFIDTLITSSSANSLVGLTYAQGELLSSYDDNLGNCIYYEINPLVNNDIPVIASTTNKIVDAAAVTSGIGVAKNLVSYAYVSPGVYDLSYDITVKNMGTIPIRDINITDTLSKINPSGTVSNVSTSIIYKPAGSSINLNGAFNGTTNFRLLNASPNILDNYPKVRNNTIIRVNCRISNITPGVVYNNRAVATAIGFAGVTLRDSSTNGTNPDLNNNDIADNAYENKPTPFYVNTLTISGPCNTLANFVYNQNFGSGTGLSITLPKDASKSTPAHTGYTGSLTVPIAADTYTLTNNANNANTADFVNLTDATGNANGRMMVVNADVASKVFYRDTVSLCAGHEYSFALKAAFLNTAARTAFCISLGGVSYPKLKFQLRDVVTGIIIADTSSPFITSNTFNQYGFRWVMPSGFNDLVFEISNIGNGGCGNDLAIDDIQIGTCSPNPTVAITAPVNPCAGFSATFTANLSNSGVIPGRKLYRLEKSVNGVSDWTTVVTTNNPVYTIASTTASDINVYYRMVIADSASGNIDNESCRFNSPGVFLTAKTSSVIPAGISINKTLFCPGEEIRLIATGGTKGTGAVYKWYTGSCTGTLVATGDTLIATPTVATTYFVKLEGDCNTTACRSIPITFNCDIDDDDDGIPDLVENAGVNIEKDSNFDGTPDIFDNTTPGFVDTNGDDVDDRYDADQDGIANQYDRDSDNDGIPDVVESFGVDSLGDGIIDNYTDSDLDGFSQNVDANSSGWVSSGRGLSDIDLDGDGIPNFLDLDSDNDGIPDIIEAQGADTNNDGKLDGAFVDANTDGFNDNFDLTACILTTSQDNNGDGRADRIKFDNMDNDGRANPYDLDSDGDGITDVIEMLYGQFVASGSSLFWDVDLDGFVDGAINSKGWNTAIDAAASWTMPNSDTDTRPNYLDIDSDNDGITDNIEAQTTFSTGAAYLLPNTTDADNDGLCDRYDNFLGQFKGGRLNPYNIDGDTRPDFLDLDTDNDGVLDLKEGNDYNRNGNYTDDTNALLNTDADADGLDGRFDLITGANPTAQYLGDLGSFTARAAGSFGSNASVWRIVASQYDRDWRYKLGLLNITNVKLEGTLNNQIALLNWSYQKDFGFATVILERSDDGVRFYPIFTHIDTSNVPRVSTFGYADNWIALLNDKYYYRINVTSSDATQKYSTVVALKSNNLKLSTIQLYPNPAKSFTSIIVNAAQKQKATMQIVDAQGKIIWQQNSQLQLGSNVINIDGIANWSKGIYVVKVQIDNNLQTQKLIIQ
jgi:uncharacterized repeat protein (TIGR01451 family)